MVNSLINKKKRNVTEKNVINGKKLPHEHSQNPIKKSTKEKKMNTEFGFWLGRAHKFDIIK